MLSLGQDQFRVAQDQSTVAHQAQTAVAEYSLTSCMWAHFQIGSHAMPGQRHSQTSLGQGCMHVRCSLPPALLAEWPGSFACHCGNKEVDWTLYKSQHTKLSLEKKILPLLLPGFELASFQSRVLTLFNQQAVLFRLNYFIISTRGIHSSIHSPPQTPHA